MDKQQEDVFWETINTFDKVGLLRYVMIIGSWAEYIYSYYFTSDFTSSLRTTDLDFLYKNIRKPQRQINIISKLTQNGFVYKEECRDYMVTVPEPAAYVLHKLSINPMREPEKQSKDIRALRELLKHINASTNDNARLKIIFDKLFKKQQKIILETADKNFIELM